MIERTTCHDCGSTLIICARPECRKPFPRRPDEDERSWGVRKYCSVECATAVRLLGQRDRSVNRLIAEKPCQAPGCTNMARQRRNESPSSFEERKYCCLQCAVKARVAQGKPTAAPAPAPAPKVSLVKRKRERPQRASLIRKQWTPPIAPQPPQELWRPAFWRERDKAGL